jgi:predicted kinase
MNAHLILLIGLPGSGKSSLAKRLATESRHCQVVSADALRAKLADESSQREGQQLWREIEQQLQQAVQRFQEPRGEVIYDATNAAFGTRRRAIRLARAAGFTQITGVWVDTPLWLCLKRNRQRTRNVPELSVIAMYCQLLIAPPSPQEDLEHLIRYSAFSDEILSLIEWLEALQQR